jgi:soluble lytic murein transglycosylase
MAWLAEAPAARRRLTICPHKPIRDNGVGHLSAPMQARELMASFLKVAALTAGAVALVLWPTRPVTGWAATDDQTALPLSSDLWLAPATDTPASRQPFAQAVELLNDDQPEKALPFFAKATADPALGGYALLYLGRTQLKLNREKDAAFSAQQLLSTSPSGHLGDAALWLAADASELLGDWPAVVRALQALANNQAADPQRTQLRLGRAAVKVDDKRLAAAAFNKVYYEYPLTVEADEAREELDKLNAPNPPAPPTPDRVKLDLTRAERLYNAGRYTDARKSFDSLRTLVAGDERQMVDLRLAECDYQLKRYQQAHDGLRAYIDRAKNRQQEAQFFYLNALRQLGRKDEYLALVRAFVDGNPNQPFAEAALNELGTYYILENDDAKAAEVFAEMYRLFPRGVYGERAAWKAGWWAYKNGEYAETIRVFESAAITFPRADYRPAWLYWTARARVAMNDRENAEAGFRQVIADYRNSYYGRQATHEVERLIAPTRPAGAGPVAPARRTLPPTIVAGVAPPNAPLIRALLAAGLYDDAILEVRKIQRISGSTPMLDATIAYALNRKGDLRLGITAMRRAYPQFMSHGGEALPTPILEVIFPVDHWELISKHSALKKLDPFLMTALIAQESTFQADIRSSANAYGLMQIVPATGRRYASTLGIRPFRTARLTEAETNIRIGMTYFSDLLRQFGNVAPALAAYNAGEHRVSRWLAERPGVDQDEFIDDIPFPETQNYVKRIIGTAEDYRTLYRRLQR